MLGKPALPPYFEEGLVESRRLLARIAPETCDVVLLGDSLARQWPLDLWRPARALGLGIGGDRIENVAWRLQQTDHSILKTKVVALAAGTNNIWSGDGADLAFATLIDLVAAIERVWPTARLRILTLCRFPEPLAYLNERVDQFNQNVEAQFDGQIVNTLSLFGGHGACFQDDLIHFSIEGYTRLIESLQPLVAD